MKSYSLFWAAVATTIRIAESSACGGFALFPLQDPDTLSAVCPPGTNFGTGSFVCCPEGTKLSTTSESYICCPGDEDCTKDIIPDNIVCADPSWVLWSKGLSTSTTACCMKGYAPALQRFCKKGDDVAKLYSTLPITGKPPRECTAKAATPVTASGSGTSTVMPGTMSASATGMVMGGGNSAANATASATASATAGIGTTSRPEGILLPVVIAAAVAWFIGGV